MKKKTSTKNLTLLFTAVSQDQEECLEHSRWSTVYLNEYIVSIYMNLNLFIYLFLEGKRGRKRGRETSMCACLFCTPYWGPGPQPRHVTWLGIKLATSCFAGRHLIHWATPARAFIWILEISYLILALEEKDHLNPHFIDEENKGLKHSDEWDLSPLVCGQPGHSLSLFSIQIHFLFVTLFCLSLP